LEVKDNEQTKLLERLSSAYSNATSCELFRCDLCCCWSCSAVTWEIEEEESGREEEEEEEEKGRKGENESESGNITKAVSMPYTNFL
jgi:hypothetical protein